MTLKILGGFAKGHTLSVPKGDLVRPTSVLLRRRVFDFFQKLDDVTFVDLCAGSGAVAFEAWSRGASRIFLNEISKHVLKIIEENREELSVRFALKSPADFMISQMSAEKNLLQFKKNYQHFSESEKEENIIFLDPPYNQIEIYQKVIQILTEESWFFGQLWVESDYQKGLSQEQLIALGLKLDKVFEQGSSYLSVTNFPQQ